MRASSFREVRWLTIISRLCLCLAVVGIAILGAAGSTAAASTTGGLPEIKEFNAEPLTLKDGDFALYSFVVRNAMNIQVIEAGEIIKEINGFGSTTYKGTAKGRTTYQIRTGDSNTFDTFLVASNRNGSKREKLTLSFETKRQPKTSSLIPPVSDEGATESRSPQWLPQISSLVPSVPSTTTRNEPDFFECPSDCAYCLKPAEAASLGLTQKCSDERCYYSPDDQQNWYCYSEPEKVWCCSKGEVYEATREQCDQVGGSGYATEAEATKACQPVTCWCCVDGKVYEITREQCDQVGGSCYTTQSEAVKRCQQETMCWCCAGGKVGQTTVAQCAQMGGSCYATQYEAIQRCQQETACWCCANGQVYQATVAQCAQMGGTCYSTQTEAIRYCQQQTACWCCAGGKVYQATVAQCAQMGGTCYSTQTEAIRYCQQQTACWCCAGGKVYQTTAAQCAQAGGTCYTTQSQATQACQSVESPYYIQ